MSDKHPWRNEETLRKKYWDEGLSMNAISDEFGCSYSTVRDWMEKFDIDRRGDGGTNPNAKYKDKEWLEKQYHTEERSTAEIAELCSCDAETIRNWMCKYEIDRRDNAPNPDAPYRDEELMYNLYVNKEMSITEIARKLDYAKRTINEWLHRHNIETRKSNQEKPPYYHTNKDGYEVVHTHTNGSVVTFRVHRLVAIAHGKLDPLDISNREIDIHHNNNIPWDNRPENIESISRADHASLHHG